VWERGYKVKLCVSILVCGGVLHMCVRILEEGMHVCLREEGRLRV